VSAQPNERRLPGERYERLLRNTGRWAETAAILVLVVAFVGPVLIVLTTAVRSSAEIAREPFGWPTQIHIENFFIAWDTGRFGSYIGNTVIYTTATVIGVCLLASLAGYALARIRFPGRQVILAVLLVGLIVPFQAIMIPLYYLLVDLKLVGTYPAMIIASIALGIPFGVFKTLPEDIAEAARLDGSSEFGVFWRVMLPLTAPGLATLAVFQFLGTWNSFLLPLIVVPVENLRPIALGLVFFSGARSTDRELVAAGIILMNIPVLLVFIALQRHFIRGVTASTTRL
jgi:raffinose/stachyose/melibiose transport system permease protein